MASKESLPWHLRRRPGPNPRSVDAVCVGAEYTAEEVEFLKAMDAWMHRVHCRFPTFVEVLNVAKALGYIREELPQPNHIR